MDYTKVPQEINNVVGDNVKLLAQLFPSAVKDGQVDFEALKDELGQFEEVGKEKYELTWAGKQNAKKKAQEDVYNRTLKYIEADSKNPETTENLYIEGDNLEVLKLLRQNYYGAIKMIYIDPPYNTGDDYIYNDKRRMNRIQSDILEDIRDDASSLMVKNQKSSNLFHAKWLDEIYPVLKLSKDLLKDDGVIFISIDYNENFNLRAIMDEIFGRDAFIGEIYWESKTKSQNTETSFNKLQPKAEMIFVYSKKEKRRFNLIKSGEKKYPLNDKNGVYREHILEVMNANGIRGRETMIFDISDGVATVSLPEGKQWQIGQEQVSIYKNAGDLFIRDDKVIIKMRPSYERNEKTEPFWGMFTKELGTAESAKKELTSLLGTHGFETVKPIEIIRRLTYHGTNNKDIILDFFSGSATTAHAVMQLNAEDGGNRKFIMVQVAEETDKNSEASNTGFKNICEIGKERIRRAGEKLKEEIETANAQLKLGEEPKQVPDIGFKVFRTADTNIKWNIRNSTAEINLDTAESPNIDLMDFFHGVKDVDVVYEVMLRQKDVPLSATLETLMDIGGRTYLYGSAYLVCLETEITVDLIDKLAALDPLPIKFIFRDSSFKDDINLKDETFRRLKNLVERNSGLTKKTYTVEFI
ncbi:site-specific DNA-methyltransferase [Anaerotignum propionicum]|uniref:Methyltransferase n=1 Tax=Anaerotignum propionicum DSM 1682 TaxID=991789 RepID=A0A0X1U939_ANAPI|nr:site-specific DNA-methyltransferase [Anaerotignum propionicum]AMJ41441.1 putative methyltransferase [Anaerotignum propionicum DSM 1682]SHE68455.1 adenine-specific DNA-methyltransferase [[Clostridium] propionicum DSM 1682] [Anaerotignum propionicum DSM 1682]